MLPTANVFLEYFRHLHCRAPTLEEAFAAGVSAGLDHEASRYHSLPLRPIYIKGTRADAIQASGYLAEKRSVERGAGVGES